MREADAFVQPIRRTVVYQSSGLSFRKFIFEIDLIARRLTLVRRLFGRWSKTLVDCSLDDCVAVGTVEYDTDGHLGYGTYFKLKSGYWNAIPCYGNSFEAALGIVREAALGIVRDVAAATGIPRQDIKYS